MFKTRLLSGIVLVIIAFATIFLGGDVLFATLLIISLIGVSELYKVVKIEKAPLGIVGYAGVIAYYFLIRAQKKEDLMMFAIILLVLLMAVYVFAFPKYVSEQVMTAYFGVFYVAIMLSYIYQTRLLKDGLFLVGLVFLCSWGCDTCAYCVGVLIGKHKMAPKLSPKKSVEGGVGGLVQDTVTGEEYIKETLTYDDYLDIECLSRKLGVHMHAITKDGIYTANRNIGKYTVYEAGLVNMPVYYRTPEEMVDKEIVKIMYIDEPEILDQAIAKLPKELYDKYTLVKSAPFYLEIVKKSVNKGAAVVHLAEKLGLTKEETMAIGDEENDRAMLEVVGNPVVMENGTDELKKIAKYITKSNDESGVAYAIREWVLN